MTREQAEGLLRDWAWYQNGNAEARIGPRQISAPLGSSSTHEIAFLHEAQFVQKCIEEFCEKAFDRSMLMAILSSWYYNGRPLQSRIMKREAQVLAIECIIGFLLALTFEKPKLLVADTI